MEKKNQEQKQTFLNKNILFHKFHKLVFTNQE